MIRIHTLKAGVTETRAVLHNIRLALDAGVTMWDIDLLGEPVRWNMERHRARPFVGPGVRGPRETRYVFGIGTSLRSTLVGHYIVGSGEVALCFPNNYAGWDRTNSYDRLRVNIYDRLVYGLNNHPALIDRSVPARVIGGAA